MAKSFFLDRNMQTEKPGYFIKLMNSHISSVTLKSNQSNYFFFFSATDVNEETEKKCYSGLSQPYRSWRYSFHFIKRKSVNLRSHDLPIKFSFNFVQRRTKKNFFMIFVIDPITINILQTLLFPSYANHILAIKMIIRFRCAEFVQIKTHGERSSSVLLEFIELIEFPTAAKLLF